MTAREICAHFRSKVVSSLPSAVEGAAEILAGEMQANAPVLSGDLKDSIHATPVRMTRDRVQSGVSVGTDHALATEYGTEVEEPHPFIRPSIRAARPRMRALLVEKCGG